MRTGRMQTFNIVPKLRFGMDGIEDRFQSKNGSGASGSCDPKQSLGSRITGEMLSDSRRHENVTNLFVSIWKRSDSGEMQSDLNGKSSDIDAKPFDDDAESSDIDGKPPDDSEKQFDNWAECFDEEGVSGDNDAKSVHIGAELSDVIVI